MAIPTGIDGDAPVIARHQIDINAPLDTVWRLQTDVSNWPAWQADITAARLDGPFEPVAPSPGPATASPSPRPFAPSPSGPAHCGAAPPKASPEPTNGSTPRHPPAST
jgi:hypothetical protein